jgi:hypothetical protein
LLGSNSWIYSQFNIKVGYIPAFGNFNTFNDLILAYNSENSETLENPLSELHFMHGIDVGLRYRWTNISFELDWTTMNRNRNALMYFRNSDSFQSEEYNISLSSFVFNIDNNFKRFGYGIGIASQKLGILRKIGNNDLNLVEERQYALDFHLNFVLQQSDFVKFVLKPYYRLPLKDYDIGAFRDDLIDDPSLNSKARMDYFGIQLIFYNGK